MEILNKIWGYITLKKNPEASGNTNLKVMHGINKISIVMFLAGMLVLIYKCTK